MFPINYSWEQEHKSKMMIIGMLRRCPRVEGEVECGGWKRRREGEKVGGG